MTDEIINRLVQAIEDITDGRQDWESLVHQAVIRLAVRQNQQRAERQLAEDLAQLRQFKVEHGLLDLDEYAAKYDLHKVEIRAALHILPTKSVPFMRRAKLFIDQPPTPEQRQHIADETTLNKSQACEYLGISAYKFDKLKKAKSLEHVGTVGAGETSGGFPVVTYLYRKSDIDRLME